MTPNEDFAESVYQTNFSEYVLWTAYSRPPRPTSGTQATLDMQLCALYLSPPCTRSQLDTHIVGQSRGTQGPMGFAEKSRARAGLGLLAVTRNLA